MPASTVWIADRTAEEPDPTWETTLLRDALRARGIQTEIINWDDLAFGMSRKSVLLAGEEVAPPTAMVVCSRVITRHTDGDVGLLFDWLDHLEESGVRLINQARALRATENKMRQAQILHAAGVPVPETRVVRSVAEVEQCMQDWGELMIKPVHGHASIDVVRMRPKGKGYVQGELLGMREEITTWHLLQNHQLLCVQPYVPNPGRDIRITIIDGTVMASMFHISTASDGSVRHLLHPYTAAVCDPDPELERVVLHATSALGLDLATVDVVEGPDGPVVIEVNPTITLWRTLEGSEFDRSPAGITTAHADVVARVMAPRARQTTL
ncbi:hypothetical protein OG369_39140 [Streptomyces sp. NBC_01221]|uniref:ATP-grasp domain-containing protein n=1 Tax=Streptomyces sp. NBC_01221 TaxID=2903782 RepID=UPI00225BC059|nr:hypothetical protein [Streptomyces sp. NBC_01221]MCX4791876.1 hypothetical protein [Streptomyces sp. NBC_01221]